MTPEPDTTRHAAHPAQSDAVADAGAEARFGGSVAADDAAAGGAGADAAAAGRADADRVDADRVDADRVGADGADADRADADRVDADGADAAIDHAAIGGAHRVGADSACANRSGADGATTGSAASDSAASDSAACDRGTTDRGTTDSGTTDSAAPAGALGSRPAAAVAAEGRAGDHLTLDRLRRGQPATVLGVDGDDALAQRLAAAGLWPGVPVERLATAPLGDPLLFRLHGYRLALRVVEARRVAVELRTAEGAE